MTLRIAIFIILNTETVSQGGIIILKNQVEKEVARLKKQLDHITNQLSHLPDGKLTFSQNGNYYKWYHSHNSKKEYIPKSKRNLAVQLGFKKYLVLVQEEITHMLNVLKSYLNIDFEYMKKRNSFFKEHPIGKLLLPDYFQNVKIDYMSWAKEPYESNPYYLEHLIHKTVAGFMVRSKSEALIVRALYEQHIPFHYEEAIHFGDATYYPDFVIRHPRTGEWYLWEHCGRMDDEKYVRDLFNKLKDYIANGFIPSVNLILTYEDANHPLDYQIVDKIIEHYFL